MQAQDNKAVVRRFWEEVFNQRNLDVADEIFASDHVFYVPGPSQEEWPPDVVKSLVALCGKLYPDMQVTLEDEVAEGNKVVSLWTIRGTLADELRTIDSDDYDDDEVVMSGANIYHVSDGKIKKSWWRFDAPVDESQTPRAEVVEFLVKNASGDTLSQQVAEFVSQNGLELLRPLCCRMKRCC